MLTFVSCDVILRCQQTDEFPYSRETISVITRAYYDLTILPILAILLNSKKFTKKIKKILIDMRFCFEYAV